jgi:hypothetical protein
MLGKDVESSVRFNEPNFNLARQYRFTAGRRQIEELDIWIHAKNQQHHF